MIARPTAVFRAVATGLAAPADGNRERKRATMTDTRNQGRKAWIDDAEEALKRTGDALRAAWDETRDTRLSALEAAKEAANRLGQAIDQGIEVARQSWEPSGRDQEGPASAEPDAGTVHSTSAEEE